MRGMVIKLLLFIAMTEGLARINLMVLLAGVGVVLGLVLCVGLLCEL